MYLLLDHKAAAGFLYETFCWDHDDTAWLKLSLSHYFGSQEQMPPQDRINGDQKLWQLVVFITGTVLIATGVLQWFFRPKIPIELYQWVLLAHAAAFVVVSILFPVHFYLRTLHPFFDESLSSMLDGKVSESYARKHYPKWLEKIVGTTHNGT